MYSTCVHMIFIFTTSMTLAIFIFCLLVVGDVACLFAGVDYYSVEPLVIHRVKKLALICVYAVHQKRWVQLLKADIGNILVNLFCWCKNTVINPKLIEYPLKFNFCALLSFSWNRMILNGTYNLTLFLWFLLKISLCRVNLCE